MATTQLAAEQAAKTVGGAGVPAPADAGKPRRLGRGLSSLMGDLKPMPVVVAAATSTAEPTRSSASPAALAPVVAGGGESSGGARSVATPAARVADGDAAALGARVMALPVDRVVASPFQPRRRFDEAALATLAASIRAAGVMQPILVRHVRVGVGPVDERFELIAGERRWRAAQQAGLLAVPALVVELSDEEAAEHALIENMQREDLSALERATALANLATRFGLTHAAIAERLGLDRATVTNLIRLNELEPGIQALLEQGALLAGHGKALLAHPAGPARERLARQAAAGGWSVRKLEKAAAVPASDADAATPPAITTDQAIVKETRRRVAADVAKALSEHLGTKVEIKTDARGTRGRIVVRFYDLDQFEGVMARMGVRL